MKRKPFCEISCRLIVSLSQSAELQLRWQPQVLWSCHAKRTMFTFWCRAIAKHSLTMTRQWQASTGKGTIAHLAGWPHLPSAGSPALRRLVVPKNLAKKPVSTGHCRNMPASLDGTIVGDENVMERPRGEIWGGLGQLEVISHPPAPRPSPAFRPWVNLYQPRRALPRLPNTSLAWWICPNCFRGLANTY